MRTFTGIAELQAVIGQELGTSDWLVVDQKRIDTFAEATGDHQWIHVDPERAAAGPFGRTIAHGYLTLSLLPQFMWQIYALEGVKAGINYGLNKVRFVHPVPVDALVRNTVRLVAVNEAKGGAWDLVMNHTIEVEVDGEPKTACVAETISRVLL
jgi:acyl dehydratase